MVKDVQASIRLSRLESWFCHFITVWLYPNFHLLWVLVFLSIEWNLSHRTVLRIKENNRKSMQNSVWHTVNSINVNSQFMAFVVVNKIRRYTLKKRESWSFRPKLPSPQSWDSEYGVLVVLRKEKIFPRKARFHPLHVSSWPPWLGVGHREPWERQEHNGLFSVCLS